MWDIISSYIKLSLVMPYAGQVSEFKDLPRKSTGFLFFFLFFFHVGGQST